MLILMTLLLGGPADAARTEGRACVNNQVTDHYMDGWRLRTADSFQMVDDDTRYFLVTLASTIEYKVLACGDDTSQQIQIVVYNDSGRVLESSEPDGRQAEMVFRPPKSSSYFVGVKVIDMDQEPEVDGRKEKRQRKKEGPTTTSVGLALIYR